MKRSLLIALAVAAVGLCLYLAVHSAPARTVVRVTNPPIETVLTTQPPTPSPPAVLTPVPALTPVTPTFEFDRPCEPLYHSLERQRIAKKLKALLTRMSSVEQDAYLLAVYDAQENLATATVPSRYVYPTLVEDMDRIFGWNRAPALIHDALATALGVIETRGLRTGHEFITDEAWFESHGIRYGCEKP